MPRAVYEPRRAVLDDFLGYPSLQTAWDFGKNYFHVAFRTSVEETTAAVAAPDWPPPFMGSASLAVPEGHSRKGRHAAGRQVESFGSETIASLQKPSASP